MRFLRFAAFCTVGVLFCGCSAGDAPPATVPTTQSQSQSQSSRNAASTSAHRLLGYAKAQSGVLHTQGLGALPAPLGAFPAPLGAFPAVGAPPAQTSSGLCALGVAPSQAALGSSSTGCPLQVRTDLPLTPLSTPVQLLSGLQPGWVQQIYNLPAPTATAGSTSTVAVIVAFDDPVLEADLAVYRNEFGLPPCTTANGCFTKIAQDGTTNYPAEDTGWALEAATDTQTISAVCPGCKIMVVEAASANIPDLATAVDTAAARGATVISNSYGVPEAADNVAYDSHYNHPNVAIVASAGDKRYGVMFPASSEHVIAVGGTSLYQWAGGISEVAWPLSNSGCSAYIPKPSYQHDFSCRTRMMNDVAVVADPATGMAVYDSIFNGTSGGWIVVGGTSIGAPIISSIIAMGPHPSHYSNAAQIYSHQYALFSVTSGSNGSCTPPYYCTAGPLPGYNGPTGEGTPNGMQAFDQ